MIEWLEAYSTVFVLFACWALWQCILTIGGAPEWVFYTFDIALGGATGAHATHIYMGRNS